MRASDVSRRTVEAINAKQQWLVLLQEHRDEGTLALGGGIRGVDRPREDVFVRK